MARSRGAWARAAGSEGPDVSAMALSMSVTLRRTIEMAGAVRDLVYRKLAEEPPFIDETAKMFIEARRAVPRAPDEVGGDFAAALAAVKNMPDPAADAILEVVDEEVEGSMSYLAYYGASQAAAETFAAAFPDEAADLAAGHTRPDHLGMLARVFRGAVPRGPADWSMSGPVRAAFRRDSSIVASRTAGEAAGECNPTFATIAAAQAVMVAYMPDHPREYLRRAAPSICGELSAAISSQMGIPLDLALRIPAAMLDGARQYPDDGDEAAREAAVRAFGLANLWASHRAAHAAFCTAYSLAAGGAWTAAPDRDRFESVHGVALGAAAGVDQIIHYAFDVREDYSWDDEPPFEPIEEDTWRVFLGSSGRTIAGWAEVAREVDYRAAATSPENASLIGVYTRAYDGALKGAGRAALEMRR